MAPFSLVDFNQNVKTINTDVINADVNKEKCDNEEPNPAKTNVKNVNCWNEECLDLTKNKAKQVNSDGDESGFLSDIKNKNLKNQNIFDDVYKQSYIYENLSNTYLPTPDNFYSIFNHITDNKFLASWYTNSLLNANRYLNLPRAEVGKTNAKQVVGKVLNNSADRKPNNCKQQQRSSPNFELIRNEMREKKCRTQTKNDYYSNLNKLAYGSP